MAQSSPTDRDSVLALVAGTFTANGQTSTAVALSGPFNLTLFAGTYTGAVVALERSFDGGTTWVACTQMDGTPLTWSAPMSISPPNPCREPWVFYRLSVTAPGAISVPYRLSQ